MRFALLATASTLLVGFATFACSGSGSEEPGNGAPATTNTANQTSATAPVTATTGTTGSGFGNSAIATDAGTADAATVTTTIDGDAGAACAAGSIRETESNDTTANTVPATTGSFCGRVTPGDTDVVSFVMPATISSFGAGFDQITGNGRLTVAADVNGQPFNFFGRWPFVAGGTYTFTISGNIPDGAEIDYDLKLTFN